MRKYKTKKEKRAKKVEHTKKYLKENCKRYYITLHIEYDNELVEYLDVDNKQKLIKRILYRHLNEQKKWDKEDQVGWKTLPY
jgi:hypothetical protein